MLRSKTPFAWSDFQLNPNRKSQTERRRTMIKTTSRVLSTRRQFLTAAAGASAAAVFFTGPNLAPGDDDAPTTQIVDIQISDGVSIAANNGTRGYYKGSGAQDLGTLTSILPQLRKLLLGTNPFSHDLSGAMLWEAVYPGKAILYKDGRDPFSG